MEPEKIWKNLCESAQRMNSENPILKNLGKAVILDSPDMATGLSKALSRQNLDSFISSDELAKLYLDIFTKVPEIIAAAVADLMAIMERDPAATNILYPFLFFKGYHALQTHRVAYWFWEHGQKDTAVFLQNRSSVIYGVDFHPAAKIGKGIILDHAHGIVIGETTVIEDNVSMLHDATLGCKGNQKGDRHPKIRMGVSIGAGAIILGNIEIGTGAIIGAGSVVIENVAPYTTVVGVPAKSISKYSENILIPEQEKTILLSSIESKN
jgi:serine O-acetyltransferase